MLYPLDGNAYAGNANEIAFIIHNLVVNEDVQMRAVFRIDADIDEVGHVFRQGFGLKIPLILWGVRRDNSLNTQGVVETLGFLRGKKENKVSKRRSISFR